MPVSKKRKIQKGISGLVPKERPDPDKYNHFKPMGSLKLEQAFNGFINELVKKHDIK